MDQAEQVVALVRGVLGTAVVGVYLHGSGALGQLHPTSDVDLLAVSSRRTKRPERRALIERLLPISGPGDASGTSRSINLEIVARRDVRPWRYPPRLDFQYGDWFRPDFARGELSPWQPHNPDLAVILAAVLQADHPLFGPRPQALLDPVPPADLRRAMLDSIPDLLGYLDGDERNVVLTFARIWVTLVTGEIRSKDAAADWVLPRLPPEHRAIVEYARDNYLSGGPEAWGELLPRVRPCVDQVVDGIMLAAAAAP
jgi:predicted nucleotidyltransferase